MELIKSFPRVLGTPFKRVFNNEKDFINSVNSMNGLKNLYSSLYEPDNPEGEVKFLNPIIDKIYFDLDSGKAFENLKKAHKKLTENKLKHLLVFSGNNFNLYVFTKENKLVYTKSALYTSHEHLADLMDLTWGDERFCDLDFHVRGDVARITRILNTINLKTGLYCIPLTFEDLEKGIEFIRAKAKKQCFKIKIYGSEYFDVTPFDELKESFEGYETNKDFEDSGKDCVELVNDLFPCVKNWLLNPSLAKLRQRYFFALLCRSCSMSRNDCNRLAKFFWSNTLDSSGRVTKYDEFIKEKQLESAYDKDTCFPNCDRLMSEGLCTGKCEYYNVFAISKK